MAYVAIPAQATTDSASADEWNAWLRDNMEASVPAVIAAKGDLPIATAADTFGVLTVGTDGKLLVADSTQATGANYETYAAGPRASYYHAATQTLTDTVTTILNYDTSIFDPDSCVTTGAAWKFTVPASQGGYYLVDASVRFQSAAWASGYAQLQLFKNGAAYGGGANTAEIGISYIQAAGTYLNMVRGATIIYLVPTDYIDVRGLVVCGANKVVDNTAAFSWIAIAKLFK